MHFEKGLALIYPIQWQKCGLSHVNILLTLDEEDRICDTEDFDKIVHDHFPDIQSLLEGFVWM